MQMGKKMFLSGMGLALALVLLATASFAWFTISASPEISGMEVSLYTDRTLLLSNTEDGEYTQYIELTDNFANLVPLHPVSTVDGINWFLPTYDIQTGALNDVTKFTNDNELAHANIRSVDAKNRPLTEEELQVAMANGYYAYTDFWMKTEEENCNVRLSVPLDRDHLTASETDSGVYGSYVLSKEAVNGSGTGLEERTEKPEACVRVGFMVCTNPSADAEDYGNGSYFMIYEPNADMRSSGGKPVSGSSNETAYIADYSFNGTQYKTGNYIVTQPIGLEEAEDGTEASAAVQNLNSARLIVQKAGKWDTASVLAKLAADPAQKPNSNDVASFGAFLAANTKYTEGKPDEDGVTMLRSFDVSTDNGNIAGSNVIVRLRQNVPVRIRLFVWLEGQDPDCWNDIAAGNFCVNLELAGATANAEGGDDAYNTPYSGEDPTQTVTATLKGYGSSGTGPDGWFDQAEAGISRNQITELKFTKDGSVAGVADASWTAGTTTGDAAVTAYRVGTAVYIVVPEGAARICFPEDSSCLFSSMNACERITGLSLADTSGVTDMSEMFRMDGNGGEQISGLVSLDVSEFDTSCVTDMSSMFRGCDQLTALNVANFNTSNVADMSDMFSGCKTLAALNVSGFVTSDVTSVSGMFRDCSSVSALDVSGFNTRKMRDLGYMFDGCTSLKSLDLSEWVTTRAEEYCGLFQNCTALTTIYAGSGWTNESLLFPDGTDSPMFRYPPFAGCTSLVGGKGTEYSADHQDYTYARIDATGTPGYFTGPQQTVIATLKGYGTDGESGDGWFDNSYAGIGRDCITAVEFTGNTAVAAGADASWEAGDTDGDAACMAYLVGTKVWIVLPAGADKLRLPQDCSDLFGHMPRCTSITGLELVDTSAVQNMSCMFKEDSSLASIDLSGFITADVTDMSAMFGGCSSLTSLNLSGFGTPDVTSMESMFEGCQNLRTLDISGFRTRIGLNARMMFAYCGTLKTIYAGSGWEIGRVAASGDMFAGDLSLVGGNGTRFDPDYTDGTYARIDEPGTPGYFTSDQAPVLAILKDYGNRMSDGAGGWFNYTEARIRRTAVTEIEFTKTAPTGSITAQWNAAAKDSPEAIRAYTAGTKIWVVVPSGSTKISLPYDSSYLFRGFTSCRAILGLEYVETSAAEQMPYLFEGNTSLQALDLSSWNTSAVTDMSYMFDGCTALKTLSLTGWDTQKARTMESMFRNCSRLQSLNVSSFNTSAVADMSNMFYGCASLQSLDVSKFDTSGCTSLLAMFAGCGQITFLDVSHFSTGMVTSMEAMFYGCYALSSPDVSRFDTGLVRSMSSMFSYCTSIVELDMCGFDTKKVEDMRYMFNGCSRLNKVSVSAGWNTSAVQDGSYMFQGCTVIEGQKGTGLDTNHLDHSYARVDNPLGGRPGYFWSP